MRSNAAVCSIEKDDEQLAQVDDNADFIATVNQALSSVILDLYAFCFMLYAFCFKLMLGESPGATLITPPLDGNNYVSWSRAMKRALRSKNKFKFVDGTISEPKQQDAYYDAWDRCNTMILSWIARCLTPQIGQSTVYIDSAYEPWQDLKERFSKGDHFRMSDALQELHSIRQGDRNISAYFTDLKTLWEELESLRPMTLCSCQPRCSCDMIKILKSYRENEYVICFLKGLNEEFNTTKAQILLMEPLPLINKAFSLLQQQERPQTEHNSINSKVLFNSTDRRIQPSMNNSRQQQWKSKPTMQKGGYTQGRSRGAWRGYNNSRTNGSKLCTYCGRDNHTVDTCYFKHGFPPNSQGSRASQESGLVNNAIANDASDLKGIMEGQEEEQRKKTSFNFGPQQYAQLTSLLKSVGEPKAINEADCSHKVNQLSMRPFDISKIDQSQERQDLTGNTSLWILDTGATNHVCPDLSIFDAFHKIKPITVSLPNGSSVQANYAGTIIFSEYFILHDVLLIPEFAFNLISMIIVGIPGST
ncbi:PREDICTED: uncharacterized protein LOC109327761 [Lupinus angustifolius]|uniref:uncharacterized protein LOC109327761 n=1 Tax=Lupinus angustifolius TaxID=3871 RepID=UPI00092FA8DA|nr:PREDICTED: uncharacterized protein LOC109327761 [Lupinus angustifolius]